MFDLTIINIIQNIWPMVLIITVILASIRITEIKTKNQNVKFYEELLKLYFVIYIISLFYVVTFQDVSWSSSNVVPFKEMLRYEIFSILFFKNVVGNMIMFAPYGFFISYFLRLDKKKTVFYLCVIVSITIEVTQLIIGRVFDVDDIMLNILGGFIGYFIYKSISKIDNYLPKFINKDLMYNILSVLILFSLVAYIYHVLGGII